MKNLKLTTVCLLCVCLTSTNVFAVGGPGPELGMVQFIMRQLNKYTVNFPVEKAYLHFDKPYYAAGDDMWFKVYVTASSKHWLSGISGLVNVELINQDNQLIQNLRLPMANGLADGSFALPDTLTEGNYRVRAYTNWMRNAGEDYFFDKVITVLNSSSNKIFTTTKYSYTDKYGYPQVNAIINYADANSIPYANKQVDYTVQLGAKNIVKGKGNTDDKGDLSLTFNPPAGATELPGRIVTGILMKEKDTVTKTVLIKAVSDNVDVQFMPEGGELVDGIETNVAFKAVGADGLGAPVSGTVTDDQGFEVNKLATKHLGMGQFTILPRLNRTYSAKVVFADGSTKTILLPRVMDKGYVLTIDNSQAANVVATIATNAATHADHPTDTLTLVAQADGQVYYAGKSKPGDILIRVSIPKKRLPTGVVQFTLFASSQRDMPLCERIAFIQNNDQLKLGINADKQKYASGEKVKLNLAAKTITDELSGPTAKPSAGSFSVSVVNETKAPVDEVDESTILTNLLLTSDVHGYVEQPNYYFTNDNADTRANLDLVMLTQGYRKFEWKKILDDELPPPVFEKERGVQLSGHVTTPAGDPIAGAKINLISLSGVKYLRDTVTDEQGKFTFNSLLIPDSANFIIQASAKKDRKSIIVTLDKTSPPEMSAGEVAPDMQVNLDNGFSVYLKSSRELYDEQLKYGLGNHVIVLKEVVIKDVHPSLKYSRNLNGPGVADQVLTDDKLIGCSTLTQCLDGKLAGVIFRHDTAWSSRDAQFQTQGAFKATGGMMFFVIDGMVMTNSNDVNSISPNDVAVVEVLRTPGMYGIYGLRSGPGGVIVVTTKRGYDQYVQRRAPGIISYTPKGFYRSRVFYSPQYDDPKTNKSVANLRTTVYWNPEVVTDKDGNASIEFYNAAKGSYRVVVEGIDNDGKIGRLVYRYAVE
jgi:hypothetical protein